MTTVAQGVEELDERVPVRLVPRRRLDPRDEPRARDLDHARRAGAGGGAVVVREVERVREGRVLVELAYVSSTETADLAPAAPSTEPPWMRRLLAERGITGQAPHPAPEDTKP